MLGLGSLKTREKKACLSYCRSSSSKPERFDLRDRCPEARLNLFRKEVIQPQVPLRLPCYDFTPVTSHSLGPCLPCGLAQALLERLTPMV